MSSILKVDTIQDTSGNNIINENANTVTIGKSGDTVNVVGTLQNGGTNFLQGITEADQWRLTTSLTGSIDGDITTNLERPDDATFAKIGTGMTESSGIFTFPATGLYWVQFVFTGSNSSDDAVNFFIYSSSDSGSSYDAVARGLQGEGNTTNSYNTGICSTFINVTNASTFRVKFNLTSTSANFILSGNTAYSITSFNFIRLGDSQ